MKEDVRVAWVCLLAVRRCITSAVLPRKSETLAAPLSTPHIHVVAPSYQHVCLL